MSDVLKFAELLCTKFCHDVIGPVGAVSNGMEFLQEELPDLNSQALDLINSSSLEATSRLKFYRQAFGQNISDSSVSLTEARDTCAGYLSHGKCKLEWPDEATDMSGVSITSYQRKLVLNLISIAAHSLLKGGKIEFNINNDSINITADGDMVKFDATTKDCLEGKFSLDNLDPRSIQIYYTYLTSKESGNKITVTENANSLSFRIDI